jgi:hypothetical protein
MKLLVCSTSECFSSIFFRVFNKLLWWFLSISGNDRAKTAPWIAKLCFDYKTDWLVIDKFLLRRLINRRSGAGN